MVAALQHGHDLVLVLREHLREAVRLLHELLGRLVDAIGALVVHVLRTSHSISNLPRSQVVACSRYMLLQELHMTYVYILPTPHKAHPQVRHKSNKCRRI